MSECEHKVIKDGAFWKCEVCTEILTHCEAANSLMAMFEDVSGYLEMTKVNFDDYCEDKAHEVKELEARVKEQQPKLTVRLTSFPESNGKRNWTALLVRVDKWGGLVGNCGGITVDRGEYWNRVAYHAEQAKLLIGERDTSPNIMDYGDDIKTPEEWKGEVLGGRAI